MAARQITFVASTAALAAAVSAASVSAHISLDRGATHKSRYGEDQKDEPCGRANGARSTNVYTYAPGETITIEFAEYIPHPGYFRVAFDADGDDDFVDPASIKPLDPLRRCPINAADKCGTSDFYNNDAVLPNMDNLEPHLASQAKAKYTLQVTLPDVECTNCTLQIIQVMEDDLFHGPYNPVPGDPADPNYVADVYHQCIDLVLTRGTTGSGGAGPGGAGPGGTGGGGGSGGSGGSGIGGAGGSGVGGGSTGGTGTGGAAGGAGGATGGAAGTGGAQGTPAAPAAEDEGGCSISGRSAGAVSWLLALGAAVGLLRRRSRR
jgi:hypothetical protein